MFLLLNRNSLTNPVTVKMYVVRVGLVKTFTTLRHSFDLLLVTH